MNCLLSPKIVSSPSPGQNVFMGKDNNLETESYDVFQLRRVNFQYYFQLFDLKVLFMGRLLVVSLHVLTTTSTLLVHKNSH